MIVKTNNKQDRMALVGLIVGLGLNTTGYESQQEFEECCPFEDGYDAVCVDDDGDVYFDVSSQSGMDIVFPQNMAKLLKFVKSFVPPEIEVELNDEYTAEISRSGLSVGCVKIDWDKWDELVDAVEQCR